MERGILYGVGVGPGDPELLTLKAVRILEAADCVAVPDKGGGAQTALSIVGRWVEGKERFTCAVPMVRDRAALDAAHEKAADEVCKRLDGGKTVAFITLGDPAVYSTYSYIHQKVLDRGYEARLVPGVPSFCAAAAALNTSLCRGAERLLIVPGCEERGDTYEFRANKVYMKAGRSMDALRAELKARGLLDRASAASNVGLPGERIWPRLEEMDGAGYFSVVLVKEGE